MKINTTARLATVLIISVVLMYAVFALIINRSVESRYLDFKTASDTQTLVNQLRSLTSDFVIYQTERAQQQWWTVQDELLARLASPEYQAVQKNYYLEDFQAQLQLMGEAFTKLTEAGEKTGLPAAAAAINQEFRNRLITQIELIFREIFLSLSGVRDQIGEEVVSLQLRSTWLDGIALLILISFILANALFLQRSVVQPVLQLHESARIIGQGNLDHRVAPAGSGEIRELLQTFNEMTANLQEITVSRDELAQEMEERRRAEEARLASEERFRAFMDNSPAIAWAKDEAGRHVYLSKTYEKRFGVRWEDWQGKTDFELWPQEIADVFRKNDQAVLAGGDAIDVLEETINPDGSHSSWWNFKFPFFDAAGVRYVGGIGVDITARKQAEEALRESEQRLRRFVESGLFGVIYWNMNGKITDANDKFLEMVGYQREDLTTGGIDWLNMTPPEYSHLDEESVKELQAIGINKTPFEKEYFRKDGTRLPIIVAGAMLDEARFNGVAFVLDITARKQAEEALRRTHDELEQRVVARTKELNQAVVKLQEEISQRRKTEEALRESQERLRLLANQLINAQEMERGRLSRDIHDDFGQSLMVLQMQLNAILKKNSLEPEIRPHLEKVVSYLLEVTEKVRRFSQDLSPPSLERLGLTEALRELFEDFQELDDNRGMIITADLDEIKDILPIEDDIVIYRISQEFLSNTRKHSNATKMAMAMKVLPDKVAITLEDNGQGFDLDEIKNRPKDSRGLGLASIEERLKMIGSHFSLTSRAGLGTMLHFEILRPGKENTLQGF